MNLFLRLCLFVFIGATPAHAEAVRRITMKEARHQALARHPGVAAADFNTQAAQQAVLQNRAAYLPSLEGRLGGVTVTESGVRAPGEGLQLSGIYERASASLHLSQLITDFGRTRELTASSSLQARAQAESARTTRARLLLEVDSACLAVLQAKALLEVADQTVTTRSLLRDNTVSLQKNHLKSDIDVSFAQVGLQEAELLQSHVRKDLQAAYSALARLLMDPKATRYEVTGSTSTADLPKTASTLIDLALNKRPEIAELRLKRDAAAKLALAEKALIRPRLSLLASAGAIPYGDKSLDESYAAAGVVLSVPLLSGGAYTARRKEAELRAQAAEQLVKDEEARITLQVQTAWLNASNAEERMAITARLTGQARQSYALAEARYKAGSGSVVELSQAQLQLTAAQIGEKNTFYEYQLLRSVLDFECGVILKDDMSGK